MDTLDDIWAAFENDCISKDVTDNVRAELACAFLAGAAAATSLLARGKIDVHSLSAQINGAVLDAEQGKS